MKKRNKLVALLLAAVMVLGMMPSMASHAHAEEYPAIALDTETLVEISTNGAVAYFTFTPEATDLYHFYSSSIEGSYADTYGSIYDAEMNLVAYNDDASYPYAIEGITGPNFCVSQVLEAGVTYILEARLYSAFTTGSFNVTIIQGHEYTSEVTKEATCDADGVLTYTCAHCGASYEEVIPAAHSYGEDGNCVHCGEAYLITGTCGDNLTWSLDWFGKLTISGTGEMYNYVNTYSEKYPAPWYDDFSYDIKTVVVEEGVTSIGNYAFYQCAELTTVELADSVVSFGSNAFASCYALESIELPTALTEIPERCFSSCGALDEVIWNENLTAIGSNAFYGCALGDTVLPEGITTIGQYAFGGCGSMTMLTLPSTLTELATYALSSMWNTRDFVFTGDAPVIGDNCFNYVQADVWYPLGNETYTDEVKQNYGGTLIWKGICTGAHTFGQPTLTEATCETGSYMTSTCTVCGYTTVSPENDDALGHDYQYESYNGGCDDYSYTIVTCSRCDYYTYENYVWNEHDYAEDSVVAATCTTDGYTVYTCTKCGDSYESNWVYATGHSVTEWSEPSEATCTDPSVKTGACATCGETVTEEAAPALGHDWDEENGVANEDGSVTYECTRCDATYRTEGTCLYDGDNLYSISGGTGTKTKTYTATADGKLTISLSAMNYHNAYAWDNGWSDTYWQPLAIGWAFDEGYFNVYVNDVNTAYTVEGTETDAVIILNSVDVKAGEVIEVEINHLEASNYVDYDVQFNVNLSIAHAHTEEIIPAVEPTFDADGLTEGVKCATCGEILVAQQPVAKLDYNEGIVPVSALTATAGDFYSSDIPANALDGDFATMWHTDWYGSSRDNHWIQFELSDWYAVSGLRYKPRTDLNREGQPQLNGTITEYKILVSNDGVNFEEITAGNWDANQNWKTVEFEAITAKYIRLVAVDACTDNDSVFASAAEIRLVGVETVAPPCDHTNTETRNDKAATCTEEGYTGDIYCVDCEELITKGEVIAAKGHTEEVLAAKAPTCTETGLTEGKKCTVCGETTVEQEVIDALGHDFVNGDCSRCDATLESKFEDVKAGAFYFDPVAWAVEKGITTGATAKTFDPDGQCMRAVVVTFLWRAAGEPEPTRNENPFIDVKEGDFFYKAVLWAVEKGITNGLTANTFGPTALCNRAQVVTFLYRAMGNPAVGNVNNPFTDVDATAWYGPAVLWAVEKGITNGISADTFGVEGICNRAQVVTFLYRAYN